MAGSEEVIQKAVPGGIGKPLILALLALLASGALFGRGSKEGSATATKGSQAAPDEEAGGLLGGLGGLMDKLQNGGLGNLVNSWVGPGQNQPVSPHQLGPALGPDIIHHKDACPAIRPLRGRTHPTAVSSPARACRQADPQWPAPYVGGIVSTEVKTGRVKTGGGICKGVNHAAG